MILVKKAVLTAAIILSTAAVPIVAGTSQTQQQDSVRVHPRTTMKKSNKVILHGIFRKKLTVGYRSPYCLTTADSTEYEIRASNYDDWQRFDEFVGKQVEIIGKKVSIPATKAAPGSEAEARFVGGWIPRLDYIEARSISSLQAQ
jgi:hypothetical protein